MRCVVRSGRDAVTVPVSSVVASRTSAGVPSSDPLSALKMSAARAREVAADARLRRPYDVHDRRGVVERGDADEDVHVADRDQLPQEIVRQEALVRHASEAPPRSERGGFASLAQCLIARPLGGRSRLERPLDKAKGDSRAPLSLSSRLTLETTQPEPVERVRSQRQQVGLRADPREQALPEHLHGNRAGQRRQVELDRLHRARRGC